MLARHLMSARLAVFQLNVGAAVTYPSASGKPLEDGCIRSGLQNYVCSSLMRLADFAFFDLINHR